MVVVVVGVVAIVGVVFVVVVEVVVVVVVEVALDVESLDQFQVFADVLTDWEGHRKEWRSLP